MNVRDKLARYILIFCLVIKKVLMYQKKTGKIYTNSSHIFYGGIYVGCSRIGYRHAEIIVNLVEAGKGKQEVSLGLGDFFDITYKNKNYKFILRYISDCLPQYVEVDVLEMEN